MVRMDLSQGELGRGVERPPWPALLDWHIAREQWMA